MFRLSSERTHVSYEKRIVKKSMKKRVLSPWVLAWSRFKRHKWAWWSLWVFGIWVFLSWLVPMISSYDPFQPNIEKIFLESSLEHLLGTDENGRDVLTRLFYGGRISILVGLSSALISMSIGVFVGLISGYFGGWIDTLLMRIVDTLLSLPILPLLILFSALDYSTWPLLSLFTDSEWLGVFQIVWVIAFFSWMTVARLVRSELLSLLNREFVQSARSMGAGHVWMIRKHLLPNAWTPVIIATTLNFGAVIQYEAVLSFLGLGLPLSWPSWGNMLALSKEYFISAPFLFLLPGFSIALTVLCINFIGDGLRDALDPKAVFGSFQKK